MTTKHSLRLRSDVTPGDVETVRAMVAATGFFREGEVAVAVELVVERLHRGDASGYHFVFADGPDGAAIGYACFGPIACTVGSFDLHWIVVSPRRQGEGVGRMLLQDVERRAAAMGARPGCASMSGDRQRATRG